MGTDFQVRAQIRFKIFDQGSASHGKYWSNAGSEFLSQFVEQGVRVLQVARVEPFAEPAVDRSEKVASLIPLALIALTAVPCS